MNDAYRVVVADPMTPGQSMALAAAMPAPSFDVDAGTLSGPPLVDRVAAADALVVWETTVGDDLLAAAPRLRLVVRLGSAKASVDVAAAARRGIEVMSVPSPALISVAEHAMLLMLALAKDLMPAHRGVMAGAYPDHLQPTPTSQTEMAYNWLGFDRFDAVYGRTLGLVGFGIVGRAVAERARAFGMEVLYTKRQRLSLAEEAALGVSFIELDDLLRLSNVVSLHLRVGPETEGLLGAREFALMKSTAFIINTARGGLIDEEALIAALRAGTIAGAGLDVFRSEPLPRDSPLLTLDNVVLTPHSAGIPLDRSRTWEIVEAARAIQRFSRPIPGNSSADHSSRGGSAKT